jgi:HEPN domain-containing protein
MSQRRFSRSEGYNERELLLAAADHLKAAGRLFHGGFHDIDSAGYLAHLAVELLLKAPLLFRVGEFPDSHDLLGLAREVEDAGVPLALSAADQAVLKRVAGFVRLRYPNPIKPVSISSEDAPEIVGLAAHIISRYPPALREISDHAYDFDSDGRFRKGGRTAMLKKADAR